MESAPHGCPTPVLFLIHRRPQLTARSFAAIRQARPEQLMVAADGPEDDVLCQETRRLVEEGIDWPCNVQTRFSATRLGCRNAVSQALDWAFAKHERVIVLEDDCLAEPSFFCFCTELLERYQDEERVMQICGSNLSGHAAQDGSSYYSSRFATIWGWASWRRAWKRYDVRLQVWMEQASKARLEATCKFQGEAAWRKEIYNSASMGTIDTWDIAWEFAQHNSNGVCLIPSVNLVSNLGWGAEATHTHDINDARACMETCPLDFPLRHPSDLAIFDEADRSYFDRYCRRPSLRIRLRRKIGRLLRRMAR
ncbi:glycosyltransferase family 2 protein [Prosthecobacter sp.]|uniref:glycosyltransferase family 2 protein n=1 Tax=Prosthecobacter sp. TaxID=1965333 RepID=UPI0037830CFC